MFDVYAASVVKVLSIAKRREKNFGRMSSTGVLICVTTATFYDTCQCVLDGHFFAVHIAFFNSNKIPYNFGPLKTASPRDRRTHNCPQIVTIVLHYRISTPCQRTDKTGRRLLWG